MVVAATCVEKTLTSDLRTLRVGIKMTKAQANTCAVACRSASIAVRIVQGKLIASTEKALQEAKAIVAGRAPLPNYTIPALSPTLPARKITVSDIRALVASLEDINDSAANSEVSQAYVTAAATFSRIAR